MCVNPENPPKLIPLPKGGGLVSVAVLTSVGSAAAAAVTPITRQVRIARIVRAGLCIKLLICSFHELAFDCSAGCATSVRDGAVTGLHRPGRAWHTGGCAPSMQKRSVAPRRATAIYRRLRTKRM